MPTIQCIQFATTHVENQTYVFKRDDKGRFVAEVTIPEHVEIFLGLEGVYSLVKDDKPAPAPEAAPAPVPQEAPAPDTAPADDLTAIKGIGKRIVGKLAAMGITTYAQLAALDADGEARIDAALNQTGAIYRDEWVRQAAALVGTPVE